MKINYKNTALGLLTNMNEREFRLVDDGGTTTHDEKRRLGVSLVKEWHKLRDRFATNIRYISKSFYEAYEKAIPKIAEAIDAEPMDEHGTIIFSPQPVETNTIFYHIRTWGQEQEFKAEAIILVFTSQKDKDKPALAMFVQKMQDGSVKEYISKRAREFNTTDITIFTDVFTLLLFIKYCDIETKVIDPKKSRKETFAGQKYLNETDKRITVLDSTWFTNLIVSGAFGVKGHLRWQPYGPGLSQKKLIWIDDYTKEGYARRAKVLNQ